MMETDKFPKQIKLSDSAIGWREKDVKKWLKDKGLI